MQISPVSIQPSTIFYPESDGEPVSDNTRQFRWIGTLAGNIAALFRHRDDVFVCGNQFWYPVEGEVETRVAPDVYAVFGRPKGERGSYKQWEEDNIPLTVVFDVLSPGNTPSEMIDKFGFYEDYGVEEYYVYDPESNRLHGYVRRGQTLLRIRQMHGFISPRLGIQFDQSGAELVVRYPDGRPFLTFEELAAARDHAEQQVTEERHRAEKAEARLARLIELTGKAMRQVATPEEASELGRLLQSSD